MNKIIGISLIALVFIAVFLTIVFVIGFMFAVKTFLLAISVTAILALGFYLLDKNNY